MTLYFEIYAGSLFGKAVLMDNERIVAQINIRANNSKELVDNLASYISQYNVDYVQTNNSAYAAQEIEQKINEVLINKYSYGKYIRMVYK